MNKALMEARKKFRGQKTAVEGAKFDNSPLPEGKHVAEVAKCEVAQDGKLNCYVKISMGEAKGRNAFIFRHDMTTPEGCADVAKIIRTILGSDDLPWETGRDKEGNIVVDMDKFLLEVEAYLHKCLDQTVEILVKTGKKKKRNDGTFWQNVWIQRGLGEDASGLSEGEDEDDGADLAGKSKPKQKPAPKKKVARK